MNINVLWQKEVCPVNLFIYHYWNIETKTVRNCHLIFECSYFCIIIRNGASLTLNESLPKNSIVNKTTHDTKSAKMLLQHFSYILIRIYLKNRLVNKILLPKIKKGKKADYIYIS